MSRNDLLSIAETAARFDKSAATIMRWAKRQDLGFPKPIAFVPGRVFFSAAEIEAWQTERARARVPRVGATVISKRETN